MQQSFCQNVSKQGPRASLMLPSTARRGEPLIYIRVLHEVWPNSRAGGWRLKGRLYRPGQRVSRDALPDPLVVVEAAGRSKTGRGHNRSEYLYILWHWDGEWREVARAISPSWDWQWILGPAARKLLTTAPIQERAARHVDELLTAIDCAMADVDPELRPLVCAGIEERLAAGKVAA